MLTVLRVGLQTPHVPGTVLSRASERFAISSHVPEVGSKKRHDASRRAAGRAAAWGTSEGQAPPRGGEHFTGWHIAER